VFAKIGEAISQNFRLLTDREAAFDNNVMGAIPRQDRVDARFLFRFLQTLDLYALASKTAVPALRKSELARIPVPLPGLDEQRRIADVLDKADAIRRNRKESISLTEDLLRSAFLEMFGDPVTNPKGWDVKPLGDVIERLEAGWSANGKARPCAEDEYGVLKVSAVTSGVFRPEENKAVARTEVKRELVTPRAGDLLFSRANTRELVAATCLVEHDAPHVFLPDKLWRVVPVEERASTPYLRFLLSHDRFRMELTKTATGTSGSMLNVSMNKLRTLRAPVPPFPEQESFAKLVWAALASKSRYSAAIEAAEELFGALVQRAFLGKLTASASCSKTTSSRSAS